MSLFLLLLLLLVAHQPSTARIASSSPQKRDAGCPVLYYPLNEMQLMQAPGNTDTAIRSHYDSFGTLPQESSPSTFQVVVEFKKPKVSLRGHKQVKVDWYNLLFTASIQISNGNTKNCKDSFLGFMELVETDTAWYKNSSTVIIHSDKNLTNLETQYVMTKPYRNSNIFSLASGRVPVFPFFVGLNMPIKYESSENITIDYHTYPNTICYERLIKKKIFLVHTDLHSNVLAVLTGVDVMMYLKYHTEPITSDGEVSLTLTKDHCLLQRIINPEKYVSVLNDSSNQLLRDTILNYTERFQSSRPNEASLNPLPKNINIVTQ